MNKENIISKILAICGSILGIFSIFCLFGPSIVAKNGSLTNKGPTMFEIMFGTGNANGESLAGLIVLFVFEIIVIILGIVFIVGLLTKKIQSKYLVAIMIFIAVLLLTCAILSFCTKAMSYAHDLEQLMKGGYYTREQARQILDSMYVYIHLGGGAISYSILALIGFVSSGLSLLAYKLGK